MSIAQHHHDRVTLMEQAGPTLFKKREHIAAHLGAVRRIKDWTRQMFSLDRQAAVLIEQVHNDLPGFPPLRTVIAFWTSSEMPHQFSVFKSVIDVEIADLPPSWMKDALKVDMEAGCFCC